MEQFFESITEKTESKDTKPDSLEKAVNNPEISPPDRLEPHENDGADDWNIFSNIGESEPVMREGIEHPPIELPDFSDLPEPELVMRDGDELSSLDFPDIPDEWFDSPIENEFTSMKHCPISDGKWIGERGDSKWIPDSDYVPKKSNPEGKTWGEILKDYGVDGIEFKNGEPDFSPFSKGEVEIADFSENRDDNFDQADEKLAEQRGCTPEEVQKWRKEHGYTWHECSDMKTMQKVSAEVHNNVPHSGGISRAKGAE